MGVGYCKTGNSKGKGDKFVVPDFQKEMKTERHDLISQQQDTLQAMFREAQKKKALERKRYYSVRSIAKIIGCDSSSLRKWIKKQGIEVVQRVTVDSCRQLCSTLTKEQVQEVMEKR